MRAWPSVLVITDLGVSTPITGGLVFSHVSLPRGVLGRRVSKQPVRGGDVCFTVPAGGLMGVERGHGRLRIPSGGLTGGRSLLRPHRLLVQQQL